MLTRTQARVLATLIARERATRRELIERVGLSRPTVERALRALLARGLVQEVGPQRSEGGRPPIAYVPNWDAFLIAGVDLELPQVNFILTNLQGQPLSKRRFSLSGAELVPSKTLDQLSEDLVSWVEDQGRSWQEVIAVGLAIPGPVVAGQVSLLGDTLPTWLRVPVQDLLEQQLRVPVRVYHDLHLFALAEARLGGWNDEILLFLALRPGLMGEVRFGASVLLRGKPYQGAHGNGGALFRAYVPQDELTGEDKLDKLVGVLADRAVHAVSVLDPDRVVVDAELLGQEAARFIRRLRDRLQFLLRGEYPGVVRVSQARGGEFGGALGAALAVQGEVIRSPELFLKGVRGESKVRG